MTSKRLIYVDHRYLASWLITTRSRIALLQDVAYLETLHRSKAAALSYLIFPLFFGGIYLAFIAWDREWGQFWGVAVGLLTGCAFLGVVLWVILPGTTISTRIGRRTCKVKYETLAEKDAEDFAATFFKHKSKVSGG